MNRRHAVETLERIASILRGFSMAVPIIKTDAGRAAQTLDEVRMWLIDQPISSSTSTCTEETVNNAGSGSPTREEEVVITVRTSLSEGENGLLIKSFMNLLWEEVSKLDKSSVTSVTIEDAATRTTLRRVHTKKT